jgi:serine/threonine protein kinase
MPEPERRCPKCGATYGGDVLFCPADGTPLTSRPVAADVERFVGRTVHGDVTIEALLGVGAMASVFRGRQAGVERDVAVKVLHRELVPNALLVGRFQREGRAAARIRHPNVVEVIGSGSLDGEGHNAPRQPYLVLEYLDGLTLRSALSAAGGTLPLARALGIVLGLCDGVGEAHELGIVHRDLKPENVMLVRRGDEPDFVKVLDFGLSRLGEPEVGLETHAGAVLGTARYLSPEGGRGEPVGPAADVYAIATILFECLAGRPPFDGERPVAILVKKTSEAAPSLASMERARDVPEPIAALIDRGLSREPSERPRDARVLGQELARAAVMSGVAPSELFARPTLLGSRSLSRMSEAARTRLLGSPVNLAPVSPAPATPRSTLRAPGLARFGVILGCFALGVLGALGIATHVGGCGGTGP